MKNIIVPLDFSPISRSVLRQARIIAHFIKGRIVIVHVVKIPILGDYPGMVSESAEIIQSAERAGRTHLKRLCRELNKAKLSATARLFLGSPAFEIQHAAKKAHAAYIVIGSHGHHALYNVFVGSTTAAVLKQAPCPVVVVQASPAARRKTGRISRK